MYYDYSRVCICIKQYRVELKVTPCKHNDIDHNIVDSIMYECSYGKQATLHPSVCTNCDMILVPLCDHVTYIQASPVQSSSLYDFYHFTSGRKFQ